MKSIVGCLFFFFYSTAHGFLFETYEINLDHTLGNYAWKITKDHWSADDELGFQKFVSLMGEAVAKNQCRNVTDCMKSSANPYRASDPSDLLITADCADWTYLLRSYYAWKNHLPFSISRMKAHPDNGAVYIDLRYTPYGNVVDERVDIVANLWGFPAADQVFNDIIPKIVSTANLRINTSSVEDNLWSDFYPVKISPESIHPGTTIYDPFGHVVTVYKITVDGHIHYVDAHTDNTLTTGIFNEKFVRTHPLIGGGFKNWRPQRLVDYTKDWSGHLIGGEIVTDSNSIIGDYSQEQYFGNTPNPGAEWNRAVFKIREREVSFFEYVQGQMNSGSINAKPLIEMRERVAEICQILQARSQSVESGRQNGIYLRSHPSTLPYNIYVSSGDWETYSSPSRDTVLRILYSTLVIKSHEWIQLWQTKSPDLVYQGTNLPGDLLAAYNHEVALCPLNYTNSNGQRIPISIESVRERLFRLSFDAYHCPELRWGAHPNSVEGQSCANSADKLYWYQQEQYLRNQIERRFDVPMDYRAGDLSTLRPGVGSATAPDTDLLRVLSPRL